MVYGALDEGEYEISDYKVTISRVHGEIVYTRVNGEGKVLASARIDGKLGVHLVPIEPVAGPAYDLVECIYVKLRVPIVVDDRVELTLLAPIDYGVIAQGDGRSHTLIDSFPEPRIPFKLALYGPPTQGYICRYYVSDIGGSPWERGLAQVKVRIVNESGSVAKVKLIVLPLAYTSIFYKPGTWIARLSDVRVTLTSSTVAEIDVDDNPPSADFDEVPVNTRRGVRLQASILRESFKMLWGY